ncbi:MAG TPA: EAL domain-containing protein [Desulfobacteraceae bacterium]|nr:EAL domain-containing protein [Desulfobacteraceae bacterium]
MTLYRQLIIFTLILFLLLFSGTWFARLSTTRAFLTAQLESHAQDTATSLGLSITQYIQDIEVDMPVVESMMSAVFDRGYYRFVKFVDVKGEVLVEMALDVAVEGVPAWFVRMFPLSTPEASANVMTGWIQAGTVRVKSHPGYAYVTLWQDSVYMSLWFVACGIFVLLAGAVGLRFLLRPLYVVEEQAEGLCRMEYRIQEKIPRTRELRRVVEAMNRMTVKVKEMFNEEVARAEDFRSRAYHDDLTGFGNRRYFTGQVTARLDCGDGAVEGALVIAKIQGLDEVNKTRGLQAGDDFIKRAASVIREFVSVYSNAIPARLTGGDFAVYFPDTPPFEAEGIASGLAQRLSGLAAENVALDDNIAHVGAAAYEVPTTLDRLLSEADLALRTAVRAGPNSWHVRAVSDETERMPLGEQQWKESLSRALEKRSIELVGQVVVKTCERDHLLHLEIFSRIIQEDGRHLSAGVFLPFAERLNLVPTLDRQVLERVRDLDPGRLGVNRIAVNVSPASLRDDAFRNWMKTFLEDFPAESPRIVFEFPEYGAVHNLEMVREFGAYAREKGHGIGLDHYGQSFSNLGYLQSLRPEYVKIDSAFTGELKGEESDGRFYMGSLCSVAHSIDISVIAEGVEMESQWLILKKLNIDAIQGYFVGRPKPV